MCPVELPGRETRFEEAPRADLAQLVRELAPALECFLDRPYALFGHSAGALVAYELARELRRRDRPAPQRFFASACRAPQLPPAHAPIHHLDDEAFLEHLWRMGGTLFDPAGELQLTRSLLPALRADFKMFETYRYAAEPAFDFPVTALGGSEDKLVRTGDLVAWHSQTSAAFNLRLLPGGHFFLRSATERVVRTVLDALDV